MLLTALEYTRGGIIPNNVNDLQLHSSMNACKFKSSTTNDDYSNMSNLRRGKITHFHCDCEWWHHNNYIFKKTKFRCFVILMALLEEFESKPLIALTTHQCHEDYSL